MKFMYYLAAIGNPKLDVKLDILINNLNKIYNDININYDIIINCYNENDTEIIDKIKTLPFIDNIFSYVKKGGVLVNLFKNNIYNNKIDNYDYILFILDDVKIQNINIKDMVRIKENHKIDILSLKIKNLGDADDNKWNTKSENDITINNFLEIFAILLNPVNMKKFFSIYDVDYPWMWGSDYLFGYYNIKAGIINKYIAIHSLDRHMDGCTGMSCMQNYLNKYNIDLKEIIKKYKPIQEILVYK